MSKIDIHGAVTAIKSGVSFVCAMCEHYWEGRRSGAPTCGRDDCCGPFGGGAFCDYDGPIKDFEERCFVCGDPNPIGVFKVPGENRRFGVCGMHSKLPEKLHCDGGALLTTK